MNEKQLQRVMLDMATKYANYSCLQASSYCDGIIHTLSTFFIASDEILSELMEYNSNLYNRYMYSEINDEV